MVSMKKPIPGTLNICETEEIHKEIVFQISIDVWQKINKRLKKF